MKDFNSNIKTKIDAYSEEYTPSGAKISTFFERLDAQEDSKVIALHSTPPATWTLRIAATISLLFVAAFTLYQVNQVSIQIDNGISQNVILPDGSQVALNAASSLEYNSLMWMFSREVHLSGEAFFKVKKGEKFTVISDLGSTQVLGTSFNINTRHSTYNVRCYTGKVKVTSPLSNETVILTPGNGVKLAASKSVYSFEFDLANNNDWRSGEFYFENTALKEVFASLERQYNVSVDLPTSLENKKYTGYFNNKDLNKSLRLICDPINLKYSIDGNNIVIK